MFVDSQSASTQIPRRDHENSTHNFESINFKESWRDEIESARKIRPIIRPLLDTLICCIESLISERGVLGCF
jgi:hypothetical protein